MNIAYYGEWYFQCFGIGHYASKRKTVYPIVMRQGKLLIL